MSLPIYEVRSLQHLYQGKTVLTVEHLTVEPASIVGLIGPNGSGKSTLLRLLGLIEKPTHGDIFFNGNRVEPFSHEARFLITMLPQEPFLMKRSVYKNISYGLKLRGNGGHAVDKVNQALHLVGLDSKDFARRPWYALSGGEAQRVALAARLALEPKVLLLDEPTASVDAVSAQLIKEVAVRVRRELGTTLIVASHDWQWLYETCDRIFHLFRGRIFGEDRETIIFGPWQELEAGVWGKILPDRQRLMVPPPPNHEAAAVIDVAAVGKDPSDLTADGIVLSGIVSRLSLERKTKKLFVTILVGDLPFTVRLPFQQGRRHAVFPGETIFIYYRLDQVQWI